MRTKQAEVAELADALRSGRSELTLMRVQVPPSALPMKLAEKRVFLLNLQGESEKNCLDSG